jgi:hypothetical protein
MRRGVDVGSAWLRTCGKGRELLSVLLLDHSEAAELALDAIEVAVVILVRGNEAIAADAVERRHAFDDVHRERQPRDPRIARSLVLQVELRRGCVVDLRLGAEVVRRADEQVGLLPAHEIDVPERTSRVARQGRRPHQARRSVSAQVRC